MAPRPATAPHAAGVRGAPRGPASRPGSLAEGTWLAGGLRRLPHVRRSARNLAGRRRPAVHVTCGSSQTQIQIVRLKDGKNLKLSGRRSQTAPTRTLRKQQSDESIPVSLKDGRIATDLGLCLVDDVNSAAFVNERESQDGALVLGFEAQNGATSWEDFVVGQMHFERFLASARCKMWWMTPEWGTRTYQLPPETQFMLVEVQEGGPYAMFVPLLDSTTFRATLRPPRCRHFGHERDLTVRVESGDETVKGSSWQNALYVAASWNPFELVDKAVTAAASISGTAKPRQKKELPSCLDVFGWCTWDAFYSTVSAKGVAEGLSSLNEGGTPPKTLIIDDGWQLTAPDPWLQKSPTASLKLPKAEETEAECIAAEAEALFKSTEHMSIGTSEQIMPTLTGTGTAPQLAGTGPPHYVEESVDDDDYEVDEVDEDVIAAVGLVQRIVGWIIGLTHAFLFLLYELIIDPAPPGSLRVQAFTALAHGPLKNTLLQFYAAAGDFSRRLISIKANGKFSSPQAGPGMRYLEREERLGEVISYLRQEFDLLNVYCWHGLPAYWSGVMPEESEVAKYNAKIMYAKPTAGLLEIEPSLAWNPSVLAGIGVVDDPGELYNDMHTYLHNAGVDGVKVDCQAGVGLVGSVLGGGPAASAKYHAALEESVAKHFPGNQVINCMCHSTENIYRFDKTAVARASDDFYPRDPSSTAPHIAASAYNSLFLSPLVVPDWDMFHSEHQGAVLHATARAVSGGPVYVSDKPGCHNFDLLKQLVLPNGSILRADEPARPTRDCLFRNVMMDNKTLLKVWTTNPFSGVVGIFNLQGSSWSRATRHFCTHNRHPPTLETRVTPGDVESLMKKASNLPGFSGRYAVYTFQGKQLHVGGEDICLSVSLPALGSEVMSFSPVLEVSGILFAPIGLAGMLNGSAAVMSCSVGSQRVGGYVRRSEATDPEGELDGGEVENGAEKDVRDGVAVAVDTTPRKGLSIFGLAGKSIVVTVGVRGCGEFLMYASREPADVWLASQTTSFKYDVESGALKVIVPQTPQLKTSIRVMF
eukprot:evm.model.scf_2114.1 EVM.evm.TU.scf_2114.1   scf_2114:2316-14243(+)